MEIFNNRWLKLRSESGRLNLPQCLSLRQHYWYAVANSDFGKMVSARGIAPACDLSLVDLAEVKGKISVLDIDRYHDTERYHAKNMGMNL
jgi:hypothetical protein